MRKLTGTERILLVILVIANLASFSINKYAQAKAEEVELLWAKFQIEVAEVESKIKSRNNAHELNNGITSSFHDDVYKEGVLVKNYEDSRVKVINILSMSVIRKSS